MGSTFSPKHRWRMPAWLAAALAIVVTLLLYWPATRCDFVSYDDGSYVTDNPHVTSGLTWTNAKWAFGTGHAANWHPLTWLSHMLDCTVFGLEPWGHHLTSMLFHALNAALVFGLLRQLTGAVWRSLAVAVLFAVHPLRVESVAWVAERKDVLSGGFGLLALLFYTRYAGQRVLVEGRALQARRASGIVLQSPALHYALALLFFALGLMSKPVLVTWPGVMLLLDFWPLRRFECATGNGRWTALGRLLAEKSPFFALAAAASVVTFLVQQQGGAVAAVETLPFGSRAGNALISYWRYVGKLFWPTDLAVFYPHLRYWPLGTLLLAGAGLLGTTVLLGMHRRRFPYLLMGWLWFVGTLIPMIGFVQVGGQAMADRYTYASTLGLLVATIWGLHESGTRGGCRRFGLAVILLAAISACLVLTRQQLGYWRNSETLFRQALEATQNNYLAHNSLGAALDKKGQRDEAIRHFQEAIRLKPDYAEAHANLGTACSKNGQPGEAIREYQAALRLKPEDPVIHYNLGIALNQAGQVHEAIRQFQQALRLKPDNADAHYNLAIALTQAGQTEGAIHQYQETLRLKPNHVDARYNLGNVFFNTGQVDAAVSQYREVIRLKPTDADAHGNLGTALNQQGRADEAIREYQEALRLKPDDAVIHGNLGVIFQQHGRTDEAIRQFEAVLRLKPDDAEARDGLAIARATKNRASPSPAAATSR